MSSMLREFAAGTLSQVLSAGEHVNARLESVLVMP